MVFTGSCESRRGIGALAASKLTTSDNHLMLGWEATAEATIASRLGRT